MKHSWVKTVKDCLKGFFLHSLIQGVDTEKHRLEDLFMLGLLGKVIGFPGLFNYYHLRLFPYYVGQLASWKRRTLREKDFFDYLSD